MCLWLIEPDSQLVCLWASLLGGGVGRIALNAHAFIVPSKPVTVSEYERQTGIKEDPLHYWLLHGMSIFKMAVCGTDNP